ncbi:hypothetical protein V8C34DRAFT_235939 [Trichoderma compactum]
MHRVTDTRGGQSDAMDQFAIRSYPTAGVLHMNADVEAEAIVNRNKLRKSTLARVLPLGVVSKQPILPPWRAYPSGRYSILSQFACHLEPFSFSTNLLGNRNDGCGMSHQWSRVPVYRSSVNRRICKQGKACRRYSAQHWCDTVRLRGERQSWLAVLLYCCHASSLRLLAHLGGGGEAAKPPTKCVSGLNSACESSAPGSVSPQSDCAVPQYFCKPICTHLHAGTIWHDFNRQNEKSCVECNPCLRRVRAGIGRMSERPML